MNFLKYYMILLCAISSNSIVSTTQMIEESSSLATETKQMLGDLDQTLSIMISNFSPTTTSIDIHENIETMFQRFYQYLTAKKAKTKITALILFMQYCDLLCKHGQTSQHLKAMNPQEKDLFYQAFITAWKQLLNNSIQQLEKSLQETFNNAN